MRHEILSNGLEVVINPTQIARAVSIQLWIRVGSMHEKSTEYGAAHFLEHMIFKGTSKYKVGEIAAIVDECGGEFNAYTSFDHTVIYFTLNSSFANLGISLISEVFQYSLFANEEFELEKEVIIEEVNRELDNPGAMVGRKVFELAYKNTSAQRPIYGSRDWVKTLSLQDIKDFYGEWYQPQNATLVVVGCIDPEEILSEIRNKFVKMPKNSDKKPNLPTARYHNSFEVSVIKGDFKTVRLELVFPAPQIGHFDSAALDLGAFVLGSGDMSRLNRRVRDESACVQGISVSLFSPSFDGLFEISAVLREDQLFRAIKEILHQIMLIQSHEPITEEEISRVKANLRADRLVQNETIDGQARLLGNGMLTDQKFLFDDIYTVLLEKISISSITSALKRWLLLEKMKVVVLVGQDSTLQEDHIISCIKEFTDHIKSDRQKNTSEGKFRPITKFEESQVETFDFEGIKVIYKQKKDSELFTLTAGTEGGLRAERKCEVGIFHAISSLLGTSNEKNKFEILVRDIENRGASLEGFSGRDSLGFNLQCGREHSKVMLTHFFDSLIYPRFEEDLWISRQRELLQAIDAHEESSANVCMRRLQEMVYGDHPYRYPVIGLQKTVSGFDASMIHDRFLSHRDAGPWVIAAIGPESSEWFCEMVLNLKRSWKPSSKRAEFNGFKSKTDTSFSPKKDSIEKEREQVHIAIGFPALSWKDPDRYSLDLLINILGGSSGRLFAALREQQALVYNVSPILSYGQDRGLVAAYAATSPEKASKALKLLRDQVFAMKDFFPSDREFAKAQNYIINSHEMSLQRSSAQVSTMALMELYGLGYEDYSNYPEKISLQTPVSVREIAQRLFQEQNVVEIVVGKHQI